MTKFCTNRNKQTILIESIPYSNWEIEMVRMNIPADNRSFRQELLSFLSEWFDPADTLPVHTSGSTGKPKELYVEKERMMESACLTCSFLGLQKEDSALLCMPLQYIATNQTPHYRRRSYRLPTERCVKRFPPCRMVYLRHDRNLVTHCPTQTERS